MGRSATSDQTTVLRWTVEVNREDLARNDITKPPEEWAPEDLAHADSLGLIYAWEVAVEELGREKITHGRHCTCSACAREDWTNPALAPCGMHGSLCPREYQPLGSAGSYA